MRVLGALLVLALLGIGALWAFGPRERVEMGAMPDLPPLAEVDAWLATREGRFDDLKPGAEARIVWAGEAGARTPLSLVYVHGFSATSHEIRPVPETLAARFGANLLLARLSGHGRDMDTGGAAMAEPEVADWMSDVRTAAGMGALIGERTVILSSSTGGTLLALAAAEDLLPRDVAGLAFLSPNFEIASPLAAFLHWPAAEWWLPPLAGETRGFAPANAAQAEWWTTTYPAVAVFPVAAGARAARAADYAAAEVPAFVAFDPFDTVVQPLSTMAVMDRWPGPVTLHYVELTAADDPSLHVIAGEILSPVTSPKVEALLGDWIASLRGVEAAPVPD